MRRLKTETGPAPSSEVTLYAHDKDGRVSLLEQDTGEPAQPWQTTTVTFTPSGRIATIIDPQLDTMSYEYDELDRLWPLFVMENRHGSKPQ